MKQEGRTVQSAPELEKLNSDKKSRYGGARKGAGRKPNEEKQRVLGYKAIFDKHGTEQVDVIQIKGGKTTTVKKSRVEALLDVLYQEGHNKKNITAAKEYLDRTIGRAIQKVDQTIEIKEEEQTKPTKAERAAGKAYLEAMEDEEDDE